MENFERFVDEIDGNNLRQKWQRLARFFKNRGFVDTGHGKLQLPGRNDLFIDYFSTAVYVDRVERVDGPEDNLIYLGFLPRVQDPVGELVRLIRQHSKELACLFELDEES
jgi:hypothetical protein